jgi:hypothetical protein
MIELGNEIDFTSDIEKILREENDKWDELTDREKETKLREMNQYIQTAALEVS